MRETINMRSIVAESMKEVKAGFAKGRKKTPAPAPPRSTGAAHIPTTQAEYEAKTPGQDAAAARRGDARARAEDARRRQAAEVERRRQQMMRLHEPLNPPHGGGVRPGGPTPLQARRRAL